MPAFTFEKIAPPVDQRSMQPIEQTHQRRGVFIQVLERFSQFRVRLVVGDKRTPAVRRQNDLPK